MKLSRTASACKHTCRPEKTGIVRGTPRKSGDISKPDPDLAAWCAALASPLVADKVPPGWHTAVELAEKLGKSRDSIARSIAAGVRSGRIEMQKFRIPSGQRGLYPTPHYRLLQ